MQESKTTKPTEQLLNITKACLENAEDETKELKSEILRLENLCRDYASRFWYKDKNVQDDLMAIQSLIDVISFMKDENVIIERLKAEDALERLGEYFA